MFEVFGDARSDWLAAAVSFGYPFDKLTVCDKFTLLPYAVTLALGLPVELMVTFLSF